MSKLTAAYIAGFIDGEGYIALEDHRGCTTARYRPVVKVANTKKEIIDWLCESFGGWTERRKYKNLKYNDSYCWINSGKKAEPFLRAIYPYLRLKKKQAEIVLKRISFYKKKGNPAMKHYLHSGWNWKYTPETMEEMKGLYEQCRKLNKRGK